MQTVITSKFQTTIPKKVREQLHLSVHDALRRKSDEPSTYPYKIAILRLWALLIPEEFNTLVRALSGGNSSLVDVLIGKTIFCAGFIRSFMSAFRVSFYLLKIKMGRKKRLYRGDCEKMRSRWFAHCSCSISSH
jgi:hypothetical protein